MKTDKEWMYDQTPEILGDVHLPIVMRSVTISGIRAIQADALRSEADDIEKDAEEFYGSADLVKTGQWIALTRTAEVLRDKADAIESGKESGE